MQEVLREFVKTDRVSGKDAQYCAAVFIQYDPVRSAKPEGQGGMVHRHAEYRPAAGDFVEIYPRNLCKPPLFCQMHPCTALRNAVYFFYMKFNR